MLRMIVCILLGLPGAARANVVGGDLQNFNPLPGGVDFMTVQSSETLEPGYLNVSLMLNHAVNSLPYFEAEGQSRTNYHDSLTMADVGLGAGIADDVEIGFAAQDLVAQAIDSETGAHGQFNSRGIINWRLYGKYRLFGDASEGLAVVAGAVFNRVRNNPYVGRNGSPVGVLEIAGDTTVRGIAIAANLGYRHRNKGDPIPGMQIQPIGNQLLASAAMSYHLPSLDTKLIVEAFGSRPASREETELKRRQASSAELLAGLKFDMTDALALHAGGGTELIDGASSPDWRLYAGLNWSLGPVVVRDEARPAGAPPRRYLTTVAPKRERAVFQVTFATGSDVVPAEAVAQLQALAKEIKSEAYAKVVVEGHTDSVGVAAKNQDLSQRRAETVRKWLIENAALDAARIEAIGYGEARPIADNGNFQGRARNRRVEVAVER